MRALVRFNPFREVMNWHKDIDDLFNRFFATSPLDGEEEGLATAWSPAAESYTKDGQHIVRLDLPGVNPKDVEVSVTDNTLLIQGERKASQEKTEKDYHYRETSYGRFERRLTLPKGVDAEKINASYKNGVLEVSIPIPVQLAGKKIPIQIEENPTKKVAA